MRRGLLALLVIAVIAVLVATAYIFWPRPGGAPAAAKPIPLPDFVRGVPAVITVRSSAFSNGSEIPRRYTCDGDNISPQIRIEGVPRNAKSLVLIVYDPDAPRGTFYHWLLYSIPPATREIPEGAGRKGVPNIGVGVQGRNDFGYLGYGGPCPPPGKPHRYVFLVVALDSEPTIPPGAGPSQVMNACKGHVIGYGVLVGLYGRG